MTAESEASWRETEDTLKPALSASSPYWRSLRLLPPKFMKKRSTAPSMREGASGTSCSDTRTRESGAHAARIWPKMLTTSASGQSFRTRRMW